MSRRHPLVLAMMLVVAACSDDSHDRRSSTDDEAPDATAAEPTETSEPDTGLTDAPGDAPTDAPEDTSTTDVPPEDTSTTLPPEDTSTTDTPPEDTSTTDAPPEDTSTTVPPEDTSTTVPPEDTSTTDVPVAEEPGPVVTIVNPIDDIAVSAAGALVVEADATPADGRTIVVVTFWLDGVEVGRDDAPPYRTCLAVRGAAGTTLALEARAIDSADHEGASAPRSLDVVEDAPGEDFACCPAESPRGNPRCGALQALGEPTQLCVGLSTDPAVVPRAPRIAAGAGAFAVTCMPSASVAADDTAWRVERVDIDGARLEPIVGPRVTTAYLNDARVAFDGAHFYVAAEYDAAGSVHLYEGATGLYTFLPTGGFTGTWGAKTGSQERRALVSHDGVVDVLTASFGTTSRWTSDEDGALVHRGGAASAGTLNATPTTRLEAVADASGIQVFDVSQGKVWLTRWAVDAPAVTAPVALGEEPYSAGLAVLRAGDATRLTLGDGAGGLTLATLDDATGAVVATVGYAAPTHELVYEFGQALYADGEGLVLVQPTDTGLMATAFALDLAPRPERDGTLTVPGAGRFRPPYQPSVACDPSGTCAVVYRLGAEVWLQRFVGPTVE